MKKKLLTILSLAAVTAAVAQTIPNSGFENWSQMLGEDQQPTGWISYNIFTAPLIDAGNTNSASVTQAGSPDNYQGTYSAKITTVTLVTNPDQANIPNTAGILMAGAVSFSSPYMLAGYASTGRPATLDYAAKYTPVGTDTASCIVMLTKWNGTGRDTIAWGLDYMPNAVASYTMRTVTLNHNPALLGVFPDTCTILFSASSYTSPQVGSALWVDALAFSGYVGINEPVNHDGVSVYPNPSNSSTWFDFVSEEAAGLIVYDMTGREVNRTDITGKRARINSAELPAGVYSYSVISTDGQIMSRGKFSVSQ